MSEWEVRAITCDATYSQPTRRGEREAALVMDEALRRRLRRLAHRALPDLSVIARLEIPSESTLDVVDSIQLDELEDPAVHAAEDELVRANSPSPDVESEGNEFATARAPRLPR